jgi:phytoene desaturase
LFETQVKKQAIIIGAGIAGIASAIRLANEGFEVNVYEASAGPGGKLSEFKLGNYRFDRGPSLFTMPQYVEELFRLSGKNPADYFRYIRVEDNCHYFYEDGTRFTAWNEKTQLDEELKKAFGIAPELFHQHLKRSALMYQKLAPVFLDVSLHRPSHLMKADTLKAILAAPKMGLSQKLNNYHAAKLKNKKLEQYFNRFATYNGSNPYEAPATLHIIPHLEHGIGTYFPKGGMFSITRTLYELAKDCGVKFHFHSAVEKIEIQNKKTTGIWVNNQLIGADVVVSNMDIYHTYKKLLPTEKHPEKLLNQPKSSSALIFYWGIKKSFPELGLHNILFSGDYQKEFEFIQQGKSITDDPTIYINITSKYESDDAPSGCENWFVMINTPNDEGQNWEQLQQSARNNVIQKINRLLNTNIEALIEEETTWNPPGIEQLTSSYKGALYGNSSNNRMAAFLRHPNFSGTLKGLYFVGGSVHPGGGIPLCLKAAEIMHRCIKEDYQ